MTDAYYELVEAGADGDVFTSTDLTRGTWGDMQHGAPPCALLVRSLDRCAPRDRTRLSRVVIELLGPVPMADVQVSAQVDRAGTKIELLSAVMTSDDGSGGSRPVARARAWRMEQSDSSGIERSFAPPLRPIGEGSTRPEMDSLTSGYVSSLDWRWLTAPGARNERAGESWIRPTVDLVQGEEMSAIERLFAVADNANGVGTKLDTRRWTFLNTDITVHLHRAPEGEWTGIRADAAYGPDGIGATIGTLFDERGAIGGIQQSVLLRRRSQPRS